MVIIQMLQTYSKQEGMVSMVKYDNDKITDKCACFCSDKELNEAIEKYLKYKKTNEIKNEIDEVSENNHESMPHTSCPFGGSPDSCQPKLNIESTLDNVQAYNYGITHEYAPHDQVDGVEKQEKKSFPNDTNPMISTTIESNNNHIIKGNKLIQKGEQFIESGKGHIESGNVEEGTTMVNKGEKYKAAGIDMLKKSKHLHQVMSEQEQEHTDLV